MMVEYIKKIARGITHGNLTKKELSRYVVCLAEEINRLDPRDFFPDAQFTFVIKRKELQYYAGLGSGEIGTKDRLDKIVSEIVSCLNKYAGEGNRAESRSFEFISDPDLRSIVERDYKELSLILLPGGAWKSCVIMSGSILEAILYDALTQDLATKQKAMASSNAPNKNGKVFDIDKGDWKLQGLIMVAADIGVLPKERSNSIDQVLRDYRNFIHPKKEVKATHPCTEAEAYLAKGALDCVCNFLDRPAAP